MSVGDKASVGSVRETFEDLLVAHEWGGGDLLSKVLTSNKLYTSVGVGEHHITGDPSSSSAAAVVAAERIWICNELNDATDAAETVWREAIRGFEKELRQRELEKRVAPHAILEAILMSELFLECALNICDRTDEQGKTAIQIEDPEPPRPSSDKWMRSVVDVVVPQLQRVLLPSKNAVSEVDKESISSAFSSSTMNYRRKQPTVQRKSIDTSLAATAAAAAAATSTIPEIPEIVNMYKEPASDEFEERVRAIKQLEIKRRKDIEEQEFLAAQKDSKRNQVSVRVDTKGQKFTYDFDGQLLTMKGIKPERLPPTNLPIQQLTPVISKGNVNDQLMRYPCEGTQHVMKACDRRYHMVRVQIMPSTDWTTSVIVKNKRASGALTSQGDESVMIEKKSVESQKQLLVNGLGTSKQSQQHIGSSYTVPAAVLQPSATAASAFEFESFMPSQGVKLIFEAREKLGPGKSTRQPIKDAAQLDQQLRALKDNEPLFITKSEYRKLTENGNLARTTFTSGPLTPISHSPDGQQLLSKRMSFDVKALEQFGGKAVKKTVGGGGEEPYFIGVKSPRKTPHQSPIVIANPTVLATLAAAAAEAEIVSYKQQLTVPPATAASTKNSNPADAFNMGVVTDKNWGKSKAGDYRKSMVTLSQFPRERDKFQAMRQLHRTMSEVMRLSERERNNTMRESLTGRDSNPNLLRSTLLASSRSSSGFFSQLRQANLPQGI